MKRLTQIVLTVLCALCFACGSAFAQLNTDRITAIGRNALYFEDYVLSIQYFNQVIKLKPYLAEPYLFRAIAKIQLEDYQGALRDCDASIERNPFQPGAYYTRGFVYRQLHDYDKAESDFTQALVFAPENKTYLLLRADTRAAKKEYNLAMQDLQTLLHREPQSASLLFEKGSICLQMKDTACALQSFERTTELDSQNAANWSALGLVNLMQDNQDDALVQLTRAINLGSKWAGDYINRGIIFYHQHNYRGALADYDKAVSLAPNDPQCYYNRGVLRQELGDYNRALEDLSHAIELAPEHIEMRYQRGLVEMQLRQWKQARQDFDTLISRYPYFLPSYYLAAQAATAQGNTKTAFTYRQKAAELENQKEQIQARQNATPNTDVQVAEAQPQRRDRRKEFSSRTAQNQAEPSDDERKYDSATRGSIQKRYTDVVNELNITLSYYAAEQSLRRTNYYQLSVEQLNQAQLLPAPLHFTTQETPLTADMVNYHFSQISNLSAQIEQLDLLNTPRNAPADNTRAAILFARAIEFALVQDYSSAIDDCTRAANMANDDMDAVIYFCRANWRYKLLEYQRATGELTAEANMDFDIMLRDYDQVLKLQPDFSFAYYNKANILCTQRNWKEAIDNYTRAIDIDNDFAEAYFNRGLTYIYTDQVDKGLADLSRAGELGIYQAYNLITRFQ